MEIPAIVKECEKLGVDSLAITDHLNTLDKLQFHRPILEDIKRLEAKIKVFFGVELNFLDADQGFAFNEEIKEEYGFQFAIGGIHGTYLEEYNLRELVEIQHRHHLKTCQDPLVQVLVHPYWFGKGEFEENGWPWFDSMKVVPKSYVRELGQVSRQTGTAIEINGDSNICSPAFSESYKKEYVDFLAILAGEGVIFSVGSDAHDISRLATIQSVWEVVKELGLSEEQLWYPEGEPINLKLSMPAYRSCRAGKTSN